MRLGAGPTARSDFNRDFAGNTGEEHEAQIALHGFARIEALAGSQIKRAGIGAAAVNAHEVRLAFQTRSQGRLGESVSQYATDG